MSLVNPLDQLTLTSTVLSKENWNDFTVLFGEKGACGGCWCMTPRLPIAEYNKSKGEVNKRLLYNLVLANEPLGVLAYHNKESIAWCSISPKERLNQMKKSRIMGHTSEKDTWSIVCLFIKKEWRMKKVSSFIISKAVEYAFANGAEIVEAYPVVSRNNKMPDVFAWTGIWKSYEKAGFSVVKKLSETRLIVQIRRN